MIPYYQITEFQLGPVTVHTYGLFVGLGFAVALILGAREAQRRELSENQFLSLAFAIFIGAILGARLLFVFSNWEIFAGQVSEIFALWHGGMSFSGGLLGAILLGGAYLYFSKAAVGKYLDTVAAVFPAGYAIGRIGCNMIKDHWGKITDVPWAVSLNGQLRHDVTMYEVLIGVVLFAIFWPLRKRFTQPGLYGALVLGAYAVLRFIVDFYRATDLLDSDARYGGLTVAQYFMIFFVLLSAAITIHLLRKRGQQNA